MFQFLVSISFQTPDYFAFLPSAPFEVISLAFELYVLSFDLTVEFYVSLSLPHSNTAMYNKIKTILYSCSSR